MVRPKGKATRMAMKVVSKVPEIRGMIPNRFSANKGVHSVSVRKSIMETSLKNLMDSVRRTKSIPKVVSTVIALHNNKSHSMIFSRVRILSQVDYSPGSTREESCVTESVSCPCERSEER